MKKSIIALTMVSAFAASSANAALVDGLTLSWDPATTGGITLPASGSWFSMLALDLTGPGGFPDGQADTNIYTPISSNIGLKLGTTQLASGSHSGAPGCAPNPLDPLDTCNNTVPNGEMPGIDDAWGFFGNTGMDQTTTPSNVLSASGDTATIDFSGWNVTWNSIPSINMGGGAWGSNANGVAEVTCAAGSGCAIGSSYVLEYTATVPIGDVSGFGGVRYGVHLEGTVNPVPVPAAVWLFGSGLLGLVGVARRRKAA